MQAPFLRVAGAALVVAGAGQPSISNSHDSEEGGTLLYPLPSILYAFFSEINLLLFMHFSILLVTVNHQMAYISPLTLTTFFACFGSLASVWNPSSTRSSGSIFLVMIGSKLNSSFFEYI